MDNFKFLLYFTRFIFFQLQKLVVSGDLPCTKEEAATLASIQLHIEEAWPENDTQANLQIFNTQNKLLHHKFLVKASDPQENLRRRKELIRSNRANRITSTRRSKGRIVRQLTCVSDNDIDSNGEIDLVKYLPPDLVSSKKIRWLIQVEINHIIYYLPQGCLFECYGVYATFKKYFSYIVTVSFIGGVPGVNHQPATSH